jgi:hypothetical protein
MKVENTDGESGSEEEEEEKEPDFVRAHHMFSRILNYLFIVVFSRNGILLPELF